MTMRSALACSKMLGCAKWGPFHLSIIPPSCLTKPGKGTASRTAFPAEQIHSAATTNRRPWIITTSPASFRSAGHEGVVAVHMDDRDAELALDAFVNVGPDRWIRVCIAGRDEHVSFNHLRKRQGFIDREHAFGVRCGAGLCVP